MRERPDGDEARSALTLVGRGSAALGTNDSAEDLPPARSTSASATSVFPDAVGPKTPRASPTHAGGTALAARAGRSLAAASRRSRGRDPNSQVPVEGAVTISTSSHPTEVPARKDAQVGGDLRSRTAGPTATRLVGRRVVLRRVSASRSASLTRRRKAATSPRRSLPPTQCTRRRPAASAIRQPRGERRRAVPSTAAYKTMARQRSPARLRPPTAA